VPVGKLQRGSSVRVEVFDKMFEKEKALRFAGPVS
jgi:hypothetical protein